MNLGKEARIRTTSQSEFFLLLPMTFSVQRYVPKLRMPLNFVSYIKIFKNPEPH